MFAFLIALAWKIAVMTAISYGIGLLTAKKPPKQKPPTPAGLDAFNLPTAEEGRPIQVLFGKRYIKGPNVVWYGDLVVRPIIRRM